MMVGSLLILTACTPSGDSSDPDAGTTTMTVPSSTSPPDSGMVTKDTTGVGLVALDADSTYVEALCSLDVFQFVESDDPLGDLAEAIRALPTSTSEEAAEVEDIAAQLVVASSSTDVLESPEMQNVAGLMRARCR